MPEISIFKNPCNLIIALHLLFFSGVSCQEKQQQTSSEPKTKYTSTNIFNIEELSKDGWDTLPQVTFWRKVMNTVPDSAIVNIAQNRQIITLCDFNCWQELETPQKDSIKNAYKQNHHLNTEDEIYITYGKNHYYQYHNMDEQISRAGEIFDSVGVDPWLAQSILLIESPGKARQSKVGAYGPFQLMKEIGRNFGMTINSKQDDREDLEKSAYVAAKLIDSICIPELKKHLQPFIGEDYNENEMWFKLLVLHVYHAGAGNVGGALRKIAPSEGNQELIQTLWKTEYRGFRNASQNYSQIALAANLEYLEKHSKKSLQSFNSTEEKKGM